MRSLNLYDERIFSGLLIIICFTACFVLMIAVFYTDASDEDMVVNQIYHEITREKELTSSRNIPKISKWDFTISLPVEGLSGTYHWVVKGAYSSSHSEHEQLIHGFVGETMDKKNPVRLVSPKMVFDDRRNELRTNDPIYAELGWGSISGTGLKLRWKSDTIEVRSNVEVALQTADLPEEIGIPGTGNDEQNKNKKGVSDQSDAENEKTEPTEKENDKLIITSKKLTILGEKDRAIFKGNVLARDMKGTIQADIMEVQNYTKKEREADPIKTGVKTVVCKGHVKIDLADQAAICHHAVFDAATDIITLLGTEMDGKYVQVEYWKKDEVEEGKGMQILCDKMTIDRATKEVVYEGNTKSTDFNPSKSSFLDFGLGEKTNETDDKKKPDSVKNNNSE